MEASLVRRMALLIAFGASRSEIHDNFIGEFFDNEENFFLSYKAAELLAKDC